MWVFIGLISFLVWITFGIMWIVSLIRKNGKANRNIITSVVSFILLSVSIAFDNTDTGATKDAVELVKQDPKVEAVATETVEEKAKREEEAKLMLAAEAKQKEEAQAKALEETRKAKIKEAVDKEKARQDMIASQFSAWDGSHTTLKKMIKNAMNDPDSFEHDETTYRDDKDHITVQTKYRGKNGFGGVVRGSVTATFTLSGELIEVISQK